MSSIVPTSSSGAYLGTDSSASSTANSNIDQQQFLNLLITQLKNQDPLSPMDNYQFVSQMAQFSSLEQQIKVNSNIELLQVAQLSQTNAQAANLVGKEVTAKGDTFDYSGGTENLQFRLGSESSSVKVTIKDKSGTILRTIDLKDYPEGTSSFTWDGKDNDGVQLSPGEYKFSVEAYDANGNQVSAESYVVGTVTEVRYDNGYPEMMVNGRKVKLGEIISIGQTAVGVSTSG
ncbi:MAG: flagellar biosynthesis protein FlgD [Deltaproteobacteria bacterium]|nr:flagellar biosynthesis protein FlgD [Deltaproteobacteria bacterium]